MHLQTETFVAVRGSRTWAVYEIIILLDTTNILHIFTCNYFSVSLAVTPIYMYRLGYWPLPRLLKNLKFYKGHKKNQVNLASCATYDLFHTVQCSFIYSHPFSGTHCSLCFTELHKLFPSLSFKMNTFSASIYNEDI